MNLVYNTLMDEFSSQGFNEWFSSQWINGCIMKEWSFQRISLEFYPQNQVQVFYNMFLTKKLYALDLHSWGPVVTFRKIGKNKMDF